MWTGVDLNVVFTYGSSCAGAGKADGVGQQLLSSGSYWVRRSSLLLPGAIVHEKLC